MPLPDSRPLNPPRPAQLARHRQVAVAVQEDVLVRYSQRISQAIQFACTFIMIAALAGSIALSYNVVVIPGSDALIESVPSGSGRPFYLSLWWPFQACYEGSCVGYSRHLPVDWPFDTTDSDRIKAMGANTVVTDGGNYILYNASTPVDSSVVALLNWAQAAGMRVDLADPYVTYHVGGLLIQSEPVLDAHISRLVELYSSHPGLGGWYVGNEPEGWGATAARREGMYARYSDVVAKFKALDPVHSVYASTASSAKLRFCREGQPTYLHNTGFASLRGLNILAAEDGQDFQTIVDQNVSLFNIDHLCTESFGIPFNFSMAANYWSGDTVTPEETRMYTYLMLAHGGQGIEWFTYGTDGGLVWDNQNPYYTTNFANWLPAVEGGLISENATYRSFTGPDNLWLSADSATKHSGAYAARVDFFGPVANYQNLRLHPPGDPAPKDPSFPQLKASTNYTMKGWAKVSGDAVVRLKAIGPDAFYSYSEPVSGTADWTQLTKTFTTPANPGLWSFGLYVNSASTGTVWFDDISLVEDADPAQRNLAEKFNPGFETVTGEDRTAHEPLNSTVRQLNQELGTLGPIFTGLTRLSAFNDQNVPTVGLVSGLSSTVAQGLPRVEAGVFTSAEVDGDYYVVVVNRNITSAADVSLTLRAATDVVLENALNGERQEFSHAGDTVPVSLTLGAGEGRAYRVLGVRYNEPTATPAYSEDFESTALGSQPGGWLMDAGTSQVVDEGGNNVYDLSYPTGSPESARWIFDNQVYGDFEYSGRLKIMADHDPASLISITFRKGTAPVGDNLNTYKYDMIIKLDPGAESSNGFVEIGRRTYSTTEFCTMNDENFARGDRYVDFRMRARGNVLEGWLDGTKYINCIDNSSEAFTSGKIGIRLNPGGHVRIDDLEVSTLSQSDSVCLENWSCSEWSACAASQQTRTCTDANSCGTAFSQPALAQSCDSNSNVNAPPACTENWSCSEWSACAASQQTRTCTDANACGTNASKPGTTQTCVEPQPVCTPNWQCGEWGTCSVDGQQTRVCRDQNNCPSIASTPPPEQSRECSGAGGPEDSTPPETAKPNISQVVHSGSLRLTLQGSDDKTNPGKLRFYYSLDGQNEQLTSGATLPLHRLRNGQHKLTLRAVDESGNEDATPVTITFTVQNVLSIVTAKSGKASTEVRTFDYQGKLRTKFTAFPGTWRTGASVAVLDIEGDGEGEIAVAPGRGGPPLVRIFTARGRQKSQFYAYPKNFNGGVNVAAADLDGDGRDEVVTAPASGSGPLVRVFTATGKLLAQQMVFDKKFKGGVSVTAGYLGQDKIASVLAAPASNGNPEAVTYQLSGGRLKQVQRIRLAMSGKKIGLSLALGNFNGAGGTEIAAVQTTKGRQPSLYIFSSRGSKLRSYNVNQTRSQVGFGLAAGDLRSFDGRDEIVVVDSTTADGQVRIISLDNKFHTSSSVTSFTPFQRSHSGLNAAIGHL